MRALLIWLLATWATYGAAGAQQERPAIRPVVVTTTAGAVIYGSLLDLESDRITVDVDGERVELPMDQVVGFEELPVPGSEDPNAHPREPASAEEGARPASGSAAGPTPTTARRTSSALGLLPARLAWLGERYLWIVPDGGAPAVSLGLLCLGLLSLCIHLGAGAASIEDRSMLRSLGLGAVILIAAGLQMACIETNPLTVGAMVVGNGLVWAVMARSLFGSSIFQGAIMLLVSGFLVAIAFLLLEIIDFVLMTESSRGAVA